MAVPLRLRPDLEDGIRRIHGVQAASVITTADGSPTEIHVLASPGRHAKQVARDVQSMAIAQFDLDVDHRIISVVQLDAADLGVATVPEPTRDATPPPMPEPQPVIDEAPHVVDLRDPEPVALSLVGAGEAAAPTRSTPSAPAHHLGAAHGAQAARVMVLQDALAAESAPDSEPAPRPAIQSIMVRTSGAESEATVTIGAAGHAFEGRCVGPASPAHRARLVAQATLSALSDLLGQAAEIESAAVIQAGPRSVAVSVLSISTPRIGEQVMSGSAVVRGDDADAVARSVLDALNRRIAG